MYDPHPVTKIDKLLDILVATLLTIIALWFWFGTSWFSTTTLREGLTQQLEITD